MKKKKHKLMYCCLHSPSNVMKCSCVIIFQQEVWNFCALYYTLFLWRHCTVSASCIKGKRIYWYVSQTALACIKEIYTMRLTCFCIPFILAVPWHHLRCKIIKLTVWSRLFFNERILPTLGYKIWLMQEEATASKVFHM